jgi:hypothetical protein
MTWWEQRGWPPPPPPLGITEFDGCTLAIVTVVVVTVLALATLVLWWTNGLGLG